MNPTPFTLTSAPMSGCSAAAEFRVGHGPDTSCHLGLSSHALYNLSPTCVSSTFEAQLDGTVPTTSLPYHGAPIPSQTPDISIFEPSWAPFPLGCQGEAPKSKTDQSSLRTKTFCSFPTGFHRKVKVPTLARRPHRINLPDPTFFMACQHPLLPAAPQPPPALPPCCSPSAPPPGEPT